MKGWDSLGDAAGIGESWVVLTWRVRGAAGIAIPGLLGEGEIWVGVGLVVVGVEASGALLTVAVRGVLGVRGVMGREGWDFLGDIAAGT